MCILLGRMSTIRVYSPHLLDRIFLIRSVARRMQNIRHPKSVRSNVGFLRFDRRSMQLAMFNHTLHNIDTLNNCILIYGTMKKKNKKKKITLHCIVIGACALQFILYVSLYRNTQQYATLNCSIKTRLCAGGT